MSTPEKPFDPETAWTRGTGRYSEIVGPVAASQYFDEVDEAQMHNLERAYRDGPASHAFPGIPTGPVSRFDADIDDVSELDDLNDARQANLENIVRVFGVSRRYKQHLTPVNPRSATESRVVFDEGA